MDTVSMRARWATLNGREREIFPLLITQKKLPNSYVSICTLFYTDLLDELSQNNDGVDISL